MTKCYLLFLTLESSMSMYYYFFFYEQIKNFFLKEKSAFETGFLVQFYRGFILMIQRNSLYAFLLENMSTFC